jgi:hypothetical protein
MDEADRNALVKFTYRLEEDISRALEYTTFDAELRELAWAAWYEVRDSGEFDAVREALESRRYDDRLDANGLSGAQLRFKLRLVDASREAVDREQEQPAEEEPDPDEPEKPPRGRIRRLLRKLLGSADVIVDSLVDALTGRGEAIKELKEALGIGLED